MIKPFNDNLIIKKIDLKLKSETGIITSVANSDTLLQARVIAVADDITGIKKDDVVFYDEYSAKTFGDLLLININDILGKYEKD